MINHRISVASSWQELQKEISSVVAPIAADNDLALHAWGKDVDLSSFTSGAASKGKITLSEAFNSSLNPAVVSPHTIDSPSWRLLSGTVKGVYATRADAGFDGGSDDVWMAPGLSTGVSVECLIRISTDRRIPTRSDTGISPATSIASPISISPRDTRTRPLGSARTPTPTRSTNTW